MSRLRIGLIACPVVDVDPDGRLVAQGADVLRPCPPYAVYLLAGVLDRAGHDVRVIDLIADGQARLDPGDAVDDLDLVGVSATSLSWAAARRAIVHVRRRRPDVAIVVGGVHASRFDRWVLEHCEADMVVRGDGEHPMLALAAALTGGSDLAAVPSLTWRDAGGDLRRNPDGVAIERRDLARWAPAYDQLPHRAYFGLALESSRGCAFACSFCSTPHKKRWRGGEPGTVVDRLEDLVPYLDRTIARSVYIVDDEFTMQPARAVRIAELIGERELPMQLLYDSRAPDLLRPGVVETLAPVTCSLLVGAECGYQSGLDRIGKGTTLETLRGAAAELARAGIANRADFSFILGLPWERREHLLATLDFGMELAAELGVRALFNWYAQIPGSALWDEARARGAIHESRYDELGVQSDPVVRADAMRVDEDDIRAAVAHGTDLRRSLPAGTPRPELALPASIAGRPNPSIPQSPGGVRPVV